MVADKISSFKSLIESSRGIHLSAYFRNSSDRKNLRFQLDRALATAREHLAPVLNDDQIRKFLDPLLSFFENEKSLSHIPGNFAIFRNLESFRIVRLPIAVEPLAVVADSFHVKPLLEWLQSEREFFFLGVEAEAVHLHYGNQSAFQHVDSIYFHPDHLRGAERRILASEVASWLKPLLLQFSADRSAHLYFAGDARFVRSVLRLARYPSEVRSPLFERYDQSLVAVACARIREKLQEDVRMILQDRVDEISQERKTVSILSQIARAVVQGRVKKLLIAGDLRIFGKFDRRNGVLSIYSRDLDHEDDDILDDLAQEVLRRGGDVVVVDHASMPRRLPALAVVYAESEAAIRHERRYEENLMTRVV